MDDFSSFIRWEPAKFYRNATFIRTRLYRRELNVGSGPDSGWDRRRITCRNDRKLKKRIKYASIAHARISGLNL